MFGMGFFEIIMVVVVAIIFLGPDKLPQAMVDVAKFFRTFKKTMEDAKESLEREINLNKIKEEALAYKNSITQGTQELTQSLTKEFDLKTLEFEEESHTNPIESPKDSKTETKTTKESQNAQVSISTIEPHKDHQNTHFGANLKENEHSTNQGA